MPEALKPQARVLFKEHEPESVLHKSDQTQAKEPNALLPQSRDHRGARPTRRTRTHVGDHESGEDDPPRAGPSRQRHAGGAREPDKGKPGPRGDPRSTETARDEWLQREEARGKRGMNDAHLQLLKSPSSKMSFGIATVIEKSS